jgi:hypothetical protein
MKTTPADLDVLKARRLAVEASVDERTLLKVAAGQRVIGMAYVRARKALEAAGYDVPYPPPRPRRKVGQP